MGSAHQSLVVEAYQYLLKGPDKCKGQMFIFIHCISQICDFLSTSIVSTLVVVLTLNYIRNFYTGHGCQPHPSLIYHMGPRLIYSGYHSVTLCHYLDSNQQLLQTRE